MKRPIFLLMSSVFVLGLGILAFQLFDSKEPATDADHELAETPQAQAQDRETESQKPALSPRERMLEARRRVAEEFGISEEEVAFWADPDHLAMQSDQLMEMLGAEEMPTTVYESYSDSLLEDLAEAGDLRAMRTLSLRLRRRNLDASADDYSIELSRKAEQLDRRRLVFGSLSSTALPTSEKNTKFFEARRASPDHVDDKARDAILDLLARYQFLELRGAPISRDREMATFMKTHEDYLKNYQFTEEDKAEIRRRAQEFYDELEQERLALGLGPFENNIDKGELAYREIFRQNMAEGRHTDYPMPVPDI